MTRINRSKSIAKFLRGRCFAAFACSLVLFVCAVSDLRAAVTKQVHRDGVDLLVSCDSGPFTADYEAETASGIPLTSPYAVERGANKGLVHLMNKGGRPMERYVIPHGLVQAMVRVTAESGIPGRADLVITERRLVLILTTTANGGIFTRSDVYENPMSDAGRKLVHEDADLERMLSVALNAYDRAAGRCAPTP